MIDATIEHWRSADFNMEHNIIQASLISAYMNDGGHTDHKSLWQTRVQTENLDDRRRMLAARFMRETMHNAIRGEDGSVAWIGSAYTSTGWSVQPIAQDLYSGIMGISVVVSAYLHEVRSGRADYIEGLDTLLTDILFTLRLAETKNEKIRNGDIKVRPLPVGAYAGVGGYIWAWLHLNALGVDQGVGIAQASTFAHLLAATINETDICDVLYGYAGGIAPLLLLAKKTGDLTYASMACQLGDKLCVSAVSEGNYAYWPQADYLNGIGGFSHGVTGIGWALTKLARVSGVERYQKLADAAFMFEESLFDHDEQNWLDNRKTAACKSMAAWCHGSVGIGLAHLNLDPAVAHQSTRLQLRRAAAATWRMGLGGEANVCHGNASAWELLDVAITHGEGPTDLTRKTLLAQWITTLEDAKKPHGYTDDAFAPGLFTGIGGVIYQLLKAHPDSDLQSILVMN